MLVVNAIDSMDILQSVISIMVGLYTAYRWIKASKSKDNENTAENNK